MVKLRIIATGNTSKKRLPGLFDAFIVTIDRTLYVHEKGAVPARLGCIDDLGVIQIAEPDGTHSPYLHLRIEADPNTTGEP